MGKHSSESLRDEIIADIRRVEEELGRSVKRNEYHKLGKFHWKLYTLVFGTFKELRRSAGLQPSRGARLTQLRTAHHASLDDYRSFQREIVNPSLGLYKRPMREGYNLGIIASDFHGLQTDPYMLAVLVDTIYRLKPDFICLAGDVFDCYDFSRFDKDPRQMDMVMEFDFVKRGIFEPIRSAAGNNCQIDYIIGNHEMRILKELASKSPATKTILDILGLDLTSIFGLHQYKINLISRSDISAHKPAERRREMTRNYTTYLDAFTVTHDSPSGKEFKLCGASGHTHKPSMTCDVDERFGSRVWMTLGCMAKVDAEYVEGLNKYQQGFGIVHIDSHSRSCCLENVIANDTFCVSGGRIYYRR
jgi:hypothetical protein